MSSTNPITKVYQGGTAATLANLTKFVAVSMLIAGTHRVYCILLAQPIRTPETRAHVSVRLIQIIERTGLIVQSEAEILCCAKNEGSKRSLL